MKNSHSLAKKLIEPGIFILFAVVTLLIRFQSFHMRIIDWDESIYFMWAKELLQGHLPYVNIIEDKPVGISLIYAGALLAFGKTMFSIRILAWLSITCSSFFLYKIGRILGNNSCFSGIMAGLLYSFYTYFNVGIAANTEIIFAFFTIFSFYLLFNNLQYLQNPNSKIYKVFFFIGLSLGVGFMIKYVVVFDIISMFIIILLLTYFSGENQTNIKPIHIVKLFLSLILGLALPQILILFLYTINAQLNTYIDATVFIFKFTKLLAFSFNEMFHSMMVNLAPYQILFYSFIFLAFFKKFPQKTKINLICLIIWILILLYELSFCLTRYWGHYTIQLLPPLCLLCALLITESLKLLNKIENKYKYICIYSILIVASYITYTTNKNAVLNNNKIRIINHKIEPFYNDRQSVLANYINKKIGTGKYILVLSEDYIMYDMTQSKYPTKYIMPHMILDSSFDSIINHKKEIKGIMAKKPEYILLPNPKTNALSNDIYSWLIANHKVYNLLNEYLKKDYVLETKLNTSIIYRLKQH